MNSTIQAERQAKAIQAITDETTRLGGELALPTGRVPDPSTRYVLTLEAIAQALAAIELPEQAETVDEFAERTKPAAKTAAKGKGK